MRSALGPGRLNAVGTGLESLGPVLNKVICDTGNIGVFKIGKTGISLSSDPWQGSYENKVCHNDQPLVVGLDSRVERQQKQTN